MKSIDLNENMGFKSTVFLSKLLKTWHFFGAKNGLILSGYFYAAKCGVPKGKFPTLGGKSPFGSQFCKRK
jgi:hypothetical protein